MWSFVLFSLLLWQMGCSISIDDCPDNLKHDEYLTAFEDKCYYFYFNIEKEYNEAQDMCVQNGGNLASVKTSAVNDFIWKRLQNESNFTGRAWIGLSDQVVEGKYVWRDGTEMDYNNFESHAGPDHPLFDSSYTYQDCVVMKSLDGKWTDLTCRDFLLINFHEPFVCEFSTNITITPVNNTQAQTTTTSPKMQATTKDTPTTGPSISIDDCPVNLVHDEHLTVFEDKCYYFYFNIEKEYNDAEGVCLQNGGSLASVKTSAVNDFIWKRLQKEPNFTGKVWIGLSDQVVEGKYVWRDGTEMDYNNFENRAGPDHAFLDTTYTYKDCVTLKELNGKWTDLNCRDFLFASFHEPFVCEFSTTNSTTLVNGTQGQTTTSSPKTKAPTKDTPTTTLSSFTLTITTTPIRKTTLLPTTPQNRSSISIDDCPDNLEHDEYLITFEDMCYYFYFNIEKEYRDAQDMCVQNGGNLASVKTSAVNDFIWNHIQNETDINGTVWIGLSDQVEEGKYEWRDGTEMDYNNFEMDAGPNEGLFDITHTYEDCVAMKSLDGKWTDLRCRDLLSSSFHEPFVCDFLPKTYNTSTHVKKDDCPITMPRNQYLNVLDNSCYYFNLHTRLNYPEAQSTCKYQGGNLVSIKSQKVQDFIWKALRYTYELRGEAWIGLKDDKDDGVFVWRDGSVADYKNFASERGLSDHRDCVSIFVYTGQWLDLDCKHGELSINSRYFICEFNAKP